MYKQLIGILQGKKDDTKGIFAPFDAVSFLIGDNNARILCQSRGGVSSRPPSNSIMKGLQKGGQVMAVNDNEDLDMQLDSIINEV
jgi:hypothetical protein